MRDISKRLTITRLEVHHRAEGRYLLRLAGPGMWPEVDSTLTLTAEDMIRFSLDPSEELVGTMLEVTLKAIPYPREIPSPDTVLITRLVRSMEVHHHYAAIPPDKSERRTCWLEAKTPVPGGSLVVLPPTYYELNLPLTESEYRRLRGLPAGSALEVGLRLVRRRLRDVVLTYRGTFDDPRILPQDYASLMISLARAMIAYFDGDVDVVGHYCELEIEEEEGHERPSDGSRLGTRAWQREYLAVDPLSPHDWEAAFAESVARIDAILKKRYDNRLPMDTVREFYDNIETSSWESRENHPVEELSVGLQAKYVFREGYHLPSIVIEARSVTGNRKACQASCESLSREAAALFGVRFDHTSLEIEEELTDEPKETGQLEQEVPVDEKGDEADGASSE